MKAWWPLLVAVLLPGGCILAALEMWRRHHEREHAADYVQQIQALKSDTPLALPAVRPLQARALVVAKAKRRRTPRVANRVTRFQKRLSK